MFSFRADYWKSQARKYCDFCKCWIADNKPSVEFHEKGRRHKDNVAKRLKYITKKSSYDERQNLREDRALAQMEAAALEAYRKDVESNADLTSININKKVAEDNLAISVKTGKMWREAKSEGGQTYYWNIVTNESAWKAPEEGFLSIAEQNEDSANTSKAQWKEFNKKQILDTRLKAQTEKKQDDEDRARAAREKMKERRVEDIAPVVAAPLLEEGKTNPYGRWNVVQTTIIEDPEPQKDNRETGAAEEDEEQAAEEEPPVKVFKEKTVESLGGNEKVQFKKRKFGGGFKRSVRTRTEDEED
ncbi:PREDICTED: WW domain-binding protein 4 [Nicrophorus vespilloides]|uniref:WW domain-binding protein 4 n=1 Tax=Nicrophorus vespilloides TaxID=110193 RepID=A0ABM1N1P5_NICVS|nr:PREDICTED: WW domain-binding protein 4 [Nicrophorus vespilloides]